MTEKEIADALGQRLAALIGVPFIVWDNKSANPTPPYLRAEIVRVSKTNPNVANGRPRFRGMMMVAVLTPLDEFTTPGLTIAQSICEQFAYGLRLAAGDGSVVISQEPEILTGYRDGQLWRTPVRVPYEAV
jgi:hypothetical protein